MKDEEVGKLWRAGISTTICKCSHEWGDHNISVVQTIPTSGGECLKCDDCKQFEPVTLTSRGQIPE